MTFITFRKQRKVKMRSDSISATGSRCSLRDLTPTDLHTSSSYHLGLHGTLLFIKSIAMSTFRTQHASRERDLITT